MTIGTSRALALAVACLLPVAAPAQSDSPRSLVEHGNKAYEEGNYSQALGSYEAAGREKPDTPEIWFNKGDALYQQGEFAKAMDAYEQAAVLSDDASLEARSKFNQGNAAFRDAVKNAKANPAEAIKKVERSVQLYQDSLRADPTVSDARHNIEVARQVIKQLRQMPPPPQQQKSDQNKDQDQKDKKDQQQQSAGQDQQQQQDKQQQQQQSGQNEQDQRKQQQQQQAAREQEQQQARAAEQAKDILDQEKENRRLRQIQTAAGFRAVDKDW